MKFPVYEQNCHFTCFKNSKVNIGLSAHLFKLLGAKTRVCLKAGRKYVFGEAETQLLYKSCVLDKGINTQDSYGPLEVHKQKVEWAFEWYPLGSAKKYQITLDKWLQFSRGPHSSHLISLLCPLNNKFPNPNTIKIYKKFPNQLRKKRKKNQSLAWVLQTMC